MTRILRVALLCCVSLAVAPAAAQAQWTVDINKGAYPQGGTVTDSLSQIDCGSDCTGSYADNADVTFTAARQPGWAVQWGGGCQANGDTCNLTVKKNRTITASFTDVEAPVVSLTSPGDAMSGTVTLAAEAIDNDSVDRVDFLVGGSLVGSASAAPYEVSFDATTLPEGPVTVEAIAYDERPITPNSATASRTVVVDNTKPLVELTGGPAEGSTVGSPGDAAFTYSASDSLSGIALVECSVDGGAFAACQSDSAHTLTDLPNGPHSFSVRAVDNAGNVSDAVTRSFTVDRPATTTSTTTTTTSGTGTTTPPATDDGGQATALPAVLSRVTYRTRIRSRRARLVRLAVTRIPAGAVLKLRCTGRRCPFKARTVRPSGTSISLARKVRRGRFAKGAVLEIRIVRPGMVGRVVRIRFRGARQPVKQVLCLAPGTTRPTTCA